MLIKPYRWFPKPTKYKKVETEIAGFTARFAKAPQVIFLENHGIFVAANTISEINTLYSKIIEKIEEKIRIALPSDEQKPFESLLLLPYTS